MTGETTVCETQTFYCKLFPVSICPHFDKFCDLHDVYCQLIFLWPRGKYIRKISRTVLQCPENTQPPTTLVHQLFPKQRYSIIFEIHILRGNVFKWEPIRMIRSLCIPPRWGLKQFWAEICVSDTNFEVTKLQVVLRRKVWDLIWEQLRFSGRPWF